MLEEVFDQGAFSNIALNKALNKVQLSQQDKSLVTELVYEIGRASCRERV